jgi:hypothetical protein
MPHKFILGQRVEYNPPRGVYAPTGVYVVTAQLPERDGEFEYHIKISPDLRPYEFAIARKVASSSEGACVSCYAGCNDV